MIKYNKDFLLEMLKSNDKQSVKLGLGILKENKSNFDDSTFKELYYSVNVIDRIDSLDDICYELNISRESLIIFKEESTKEKRQINAINELLAIIKVYNEGWYPNWDDTKEHKYFVYLDRMSGSWSVGGAGWVASDTVMASGLYFKDKNIAKLVAEKFKNTYIRWIE